MTSRGGIGSAAAGSGRAMRNSHYNARVEPSSKAELVGPPIPWYLPFAIVAILLASLYAFLGPSLAGTAAIIVETIIFSVIAVPTLGFFLRARKTIKRAKSAVKEADERRRPPTTHVTANIER